MLPKAIEFSPITLAKMHDVSSSNMPQIGIEISSHAAIADHHGLLKFGDGRIGIWNLRTNQITIIPAINVAARRR
jgi:hypothetical protein